MPDPGKTAKLHGLLIRKTEFGEGHCAYTALSAEQGRIDFLTFGSGRENSSRRSALLVTNLVNAVLARKTEDSDWSLREIAVEKSYPGIAADLTRAAFCYVTLEVLDLTVARGSPFPLFVQIPPLMDRLNAQSDPAKFTLAFFTELYRDNGLLPDARTLEKDSGFFPGLFPPEFRLGNGSRRFVTDVLENPDPERLAGKTVSAAVVRNLLEFFRHVTRYHTGRDIRSLSLFEGLPER